MGIQSRMNLIQFVVSPLLSRAQSPAIVVASNEPEGHATEIKRLRGSFRLRGGGFISSEQ